MKPEQKPSTVTDAAGEPSPRRSRWRVFAVNLLLIVAVVSGIRAWQQRDMAGGQAPVLRSALLSGQFYDLRDHLQRPLLVHFWATWCPVCGAEQDNISAVARDHGNVITIAMRSGTAQDVAGHLREQSLAFPVLNDEDGSISDTWGVQAVPASFIVSPDGQIRFIEVGYTTEMGLKLRLWLAGKYRAGG